jgi:hypothetical protein
MTQEQAAAAVGSRTLRNWKAAPAFRRELERAQQRGQRGPALAPSRTVNGPVRPSADERQRGRAPAPPAQQQPVAEAEENLPSGFRRVGGVPLWGDSDGWPRTARNTPNATSTTPLALTSPRPTASTTTPSSVSAAKPQPNGAPSATKKDEAATSPRQTHSQPRPVSRRHVAVPPNSDTSRWPGAASHPRRA